MMTIQPIAALKDNYIWVLVDTKQQTALIVDPGVAEPVQHFLKKHQLKLAGILITHHHWDHSNGVIELTEQQAVPVFGPRKESIPGVTQQIQEGDVVHISTFPLHWHVLDIPGHTLGHIAYYASGVLFCGDTLFSAGCGRVFEGTMAEMYASLQKIAALPDATKIYCGHEYTLANLRFAKNLEPNNHHIHERIHEVIHLRDKNIPSLPSTLYQEKLTNPFLRCDSPQLIAELENHFHVQLHDPVTIFTYLRRLKDDFRSP